MSAAGQHADDGPDDAERVDPGPKVAHALGDRRIVDADRDAHPLPHLMLLDLKLPLRTGFEVLAWARARPELARLPILILSSSLERDDVARSYELGARSYLVKSADLAETRLIVRGVAVLARLVAAGEPLPSRPV